MEKEKQKIAVLIKMRKKIIFFTYDVKNGKRNGKGLKNQVEPIYCTFFHFHPFLVLCKRKAFHWSVKIKFPPTDLSLTRGKSAWRRLSFLNDFMLGNWNKDCALGRFTIVTNHTFFEEEKQDTPYPSTIFVKMYRLQVVRSRTNLSIASTSAREGFFISPLHSTSQRLGMIFVVQKNAVTISSIPPSSSTLLGIIQDRRRQTKMNY